MTTQPDAYLLANTKKTFVGIAELQISTNSSDLLVASNLGSCLGLAVYDHKKKVGGLIHCLLPTSKRDPQKAKEQPYMYVDTGVSLMLQKFFAKGSKKNDLLIVAAGGATMGDKMGHFDIGKKNFTVLRKLLWKNNLLLKAHDMGGSIPRTISIAMDTGGIWIRIGKEMTQLC